MSRWFETGESDSESENDSSENEVEVQEVAPSANMLGFDSSESEDEKRVIRSAKDKRHDAMLEVIKLIKNHLKIGDWQSTSNSYDDLNKALDKAKNVVKKEGIPKFYFKAVLEIRDAMEVASKSGNIKTKSNARGVNSMKQKIRKWEKLHAAALAKYLENPLVSEDEEEEKKPKIKSEAKATNDDEDKNEDDGGDDANDENDDEFDEGDDEFGEGDDSDEWDDDDSDDSDDDLDLQSKDIFNRNFWVKKKEDDAESTKEKKRKDKIAKQQKDKEASKKEKKVEEKKGKPEEKEKVYTPDLIMKKLKELVAMRGKKSTDRQAVINDLKLLSTKATTPVVMLKVKTTLVSALFDSTLNTVKYMPIPLWKECHQVLKDILETLNAHEKIFLSENEDVKEAFEEEQDGFLTMESIIEGSSEAKQNAAMEKRRKEREEREKAAGNDGPQYVEGNFFAFMHKLCGEFWSSLQNIDPHAKDYVDRLRDEKMMLELVCATQTYYERIDKPFFLRSTILLRLELIYYHYVPERDVHVIEAKAEESKEAKTHQGPSRIVRQDKGNIVYELAMYLYKNAEARDKMRALLCHVYHLSLHNRFEEARDLLLISHVQDDINDADIRTRILFNRTLAQLGLCAFRVGQTQTALESLADLYGSNKIKELIAQGVSRQGFLDRDMEKEKLERRRLYPYHQHMNLDVLEAVHLLSAMFEEVPNLAINGDTNKRKLISKTFRRLLEPYKSKAFNGPPESTRDCVMAAATALQKGDWEQCFIFIKKLKMWTIIPNAPVVLKLIEQKVRELGMRMYLLMYGSQHISISLSFLQEMFSITDERMVYRITSQMIVDGELQGAWDQPSKCIVINASEPSSLERSAVSFASKVALFVEQNEKLMEQRHGYSTNRYDYNGRGGGYGRGGYNKGGNYAGRRGSYNKGYGAPRRQSFDKNDEQKSGGNWNRY